MNQKNLNYEIETALLSSHPRPWLYYESKESQL